MKKLFTLLTLALLSIGTAWADGAITVSFAYDKINASGTGTASVDAVIENTNVALVGTNVSLLNFNGTGNGGTYNTVVVPKYSRVTVSNDGTSGNDDGIRFTITPAEGCTFTPTSISFGAIREGTDAGSMYVYANGKAINEASLSKSPVAPGRNKTGDNYTKDGYSFSYNVSEINATSEAPLTIDVCMSSLKNKTWGIWDVVVTGTYTKVDVTTYTLTTTANPAEGGEITRSPNAAAYSAGKSVTLTATPNYGYEFVNWTKSGVVQGTNTTLEITTAAAEEEYVANFNALTTYPLTVNADAGGSVSKTPNHDEYLVGEEITLTATPTEGYYFVNWTDDNNSDAVVSTSAAYAYTTKAAAASFTAHFDKLFSVSYNIDDYNGTTTKALTNYNTSNSINEKYADKDGNYTIPTYSHYYMYREGYIFSKWEDQDGKQYEKGNTITGISKDITLSPVWVATTQTLNNSKGLSVVTWNFGKSTILFNGWQNSPQVGYYTKPQTVNGELIAIPMTVDATSGKVDNSTRTDALAQVNNGTKFTIPAIKGMTVVLYANNNITNTTVAGNKPSSGSGSKTATYNYTGEDGTADIVIADGSYYEKIVVTYPVTAANVTIAPAKEYTTYIAPAALDFTGLDIKAYVATEATASAITVEEVTTVPAGTALILKKGTAASYDVPVIASASAPAKNLLKGSATASYNVENDGDAYVLSDGAFHPVNKGKLAAGKAYILKTDVPSNAPLLNIAFGGETTGIADVRSKMEDVRGDFFDLQGRKVAQPTKGLYIVNGKKVVIK